MVYLLKVEYRIGGAWSVWFFDPMLRLHVQIWYPTRVSPNGLSERTGIAIRGLASD